MFGESDQIKSLKRVVKGTGGDMAGLKDWLRTLEKASKSYPDVKKSYEMAKRCLSEALDIVLILENRLIETGVWDKEELKGLFQMKKDLKALARKCDHELVVSVIDKEFHSTYDSVISLLDKFDGEDTDRILLKSEVENLISLMKEDMDKDSPNIFALSVFYQNHSNEELSKLPPEERLKLIANTYEKEFKGGLLGILYRSGVPEDMAEDILEKVIEGEGF